MRRRVAFSRDTLQVSLLPPTDHMELNYRPALPPAGIFIAATAFRALVVLAVFALLLAALQSVAPFAGYLFNVTALLCVLLAILTAVYRNVDSFVAQWDVLVRRGCVAAVIAGILTMSLVAMAFDASLHLDVAMLWLSTLAATLAFSYWCGKQFCFWATVNPRVDWRAVREWQLRWSRMFARRVPPECPEMLTMRLAIGVLLFQSWLGYVTLDTLTRPNTALELQKTAGLVALIVVVAPLPIYWLAWHALGFVPRLSFAASTRATFTSLHVWFGYLRVSTPAPGVFLLPDRWLRPAWVRQLMALLAFSSVTMTVLLLNVDAESTAPAALVRNVAQLLFGPAGAAGRPLTDVALAGVVALLIPAVVSLTIYWFVMGSVLARYYLALEMSDGYAQAADKSAWAISINRMLNSRDHMEREHVLLGRSLFGDYPVLLHKPLLHQHAHLVGDSGSRKTSLGIAPLIAQLMAAGDCSVVVLDLKGDRALMETAQLESAAAGTEFRWFALEPGLSSHVFNPLEQDHFRRLTANQQTQLILEGLSLNYGDAYGRGFFSAMNEIVLLNLMRHYPVPSFRHLHRLLCDKQAYAAIGGNPDDWKKAQHLTALVDRLASIYALNVTAADLREQPQARAAAIDMGSLLSRPEVAYYFLKSPIEPIGAPAVAKLAMYSLFSAAAHRMPLQKQRVYVVIDEFQQIVSDSVRLVFEQARSSDIHFIVAHQNVEQLDRKGTDIRDTVSSCTAFKQFFRASDPKTIKLLEEMSGEGMFETLSWQQRLDPALGADHDHSFSPARAAESLLEVAETTAYRLERNTIMDISAAANTSFVSFTEGSHFTQFSGYVTPIISDYHIGLKEYERRNTIDWPAASAETVVIPSVASAVKPGTPEPLAAGVAAPPRPATSAEDWDEKLRRLNSDGPSTPAAH